MNSPLLDYVKAGPIKDRIKLRSLFRCMNTAGVIYFFLISFSVYALVILTADDVYQDSLGHATTIKVIITFILINLLANFGLANYMKPYHRSMAARTEELPESSWAYCSDCQQHQPARCHHCPLCEHCIAKRDHHCFFIGTCVGQTNQRYFTVFCFYAVWGLFLGYHVISADLTENYYDIYSWDFYQYIPPVASVNWLLGNTDLYTVFEISVMVGSLFTGLGTLGLLLWQLYLITYNLTTYEAQNPTYHSKSWAKLRVSDNFRAVFGEYWLLNFLFPFPHSNRFLSSISVTKMSV